jgi:hypothetical protein
MLTGVMKQMSCDSRWWFVLCWLYNSIGSVAGVRRQRLALPIGLN